MDELPDGPCKKCVGTQRAIDIINRAADAMTDRLASTTALDVERIDALIDMIIATYHTTRIIDKPVALHIRTRLGDRLTKALSSIPGRDTFQAGALERAAIVDWLSSSEVRRLAVRRICDQQREGRSPECSCMADGGILFGHVNGAMLCRDTYEDMWDFIRPKLAEAIERGEHLPASLVLSPQEPAVTK